jgi:phosphatidylserine/phosphatidylglycerophosphate/cardiolipin synthase-like enzyme
VKLLSYAMMVNVILMMACISSVQADDNIGMLRYSVCFTPGENCTQLIADELSKATRTIQVQAYSFTSVPIMKALIDAKNRGLDIEVILDKSQASIH